MKFPKPEPNYKQILENLLEHIEKHAYEFGNEPHFKKDEFSKGWKAAHRAMFWNCIDSGALPSTYYGRLMHGSKYPISKEESQKISEAVEKAKRDDII